MELNLWNKSNKLIIDDERKIESEREQITKQAEISLREYYAGLYTPKTAKEAIKELEEC